jgi:NAD(P)-dependent dehydrogenase (short-subunit alcohol dehydrogenase family)
MLKGKTAVVTGSTSGIGLAIARAPGREGANVMIKWTPLVEKQIPDTMKARNMTADEVKRDVLLEAQPTKEFVTVEQVAALSVYLCSDEAAQITGANLPIDGGGPPRRTG